MKDYELNKILDLHKKWLNNEPDGVRADLRETDLREADLSRADLRRADLGGADLCDANLYGTDLRETNLREADLRDANLLEANLCGTTLFGANLYAADLRGADLNKANLYGANLYGANLWGAKNVPFIPYACPEKGEFVAFKKCNDYIVELLIPADAKRSSATTRKCRASYAKVLSITTLDGEPAKITSVINTNYSSSVVYKVGEFVYPDSFDDNRWKECSHGIHFFINRQEAVEY